MKRTQITRRKLLIGSGGLALSPALSGCLDSGSEDETQDSDTSNDDKEGDSDLGSESETFEENCPDSDETDSITVGFTGDVMLGRSVNEHYSQSHNQNLGGVWNGMISELNNLDSLFINLECCISDRGEKYPNRTYYFRTDPDWSIPALKDGNVGYTALANNHMMDFGEVALKDTLDHLSEADIAHSGAGRNLNEAREPALVTVGDVDIAFISFTDNSFEYMAKPNRPGTSFIIMDPTNPNTRRAVDKSLKKARDMNPDMVVASLHWGPNWVERPSEKYREFGHWLIDKGVDLIHGHSAHIFQGIEIYKGKPILHDCGDFVDDYIVKDDLHNDRSFLFKAEISKTGDEARVNKLRLFPIEIEGLSSHEASTEAANWSLSRMEKLSSELGTETRRSGRELLIEIPDSEC